MCFGNFEVIYGARIQEVCMVRSFTKRGGYEDGQWVDSALRTLLLVEIEVPDSGDPSRFARKVLEDQDNPWATMEYPDSVRPIYRCIVWRKHMSTMWHEDGCRVLMTCDVPQVFLQFNTATVSISSLHKSMASTVGMLGTWGEHESEDPARHPDPDDSRYMYGPGEDPEPQIPGRPRVVITEGEEVLQEWCRHIDLRPWHLPLFFDLHHVLDRFRERNRVDDF